MVDKERCDISGLSCEMKEVDGYLPCARCLVARRAIEKKLDEITGQRVVLPALNIMEGLVGKVVVVRVTDGRMEVGEEIS
ncbi:hypothetical protein KJ909_01865 [Patescibacteria group bacterium]|nr:hypothetical protein [Patescibacteria group bacterium]